MSPIEIGGPSAINLLRKTSEVSISIEDETAAGGDIPAGSPYGLLLALTVPETLLGGGSSLNVHTINTLLQRNSRRGFLINDGPGELDLQHSPNGTDFGDAFTVSSGETFQLNDISVHTLRVQYVASSTASYRIYAI